MCVWLGGWMEGAGWRIGYMLVRFPDYRTTMGPITVIDIANPYRLAGTLGFVIVWFFFPQEFFFEELRIGALAFFL